MTEECCRGTARSIFAELCRVGAESDDEKEFIIPNKDFDKIGLYFETKGEKEVRQATLQEVETLIISFQNKFLNEEGIIKEPDTEYYFLLEELKDKIQSLKEEK